VSFYYTLQNYLYRWLPCKYFILLMMGVWRPKHVEKVCSKVSSLVLFYYTLENYLYRWLPCKYFILLMMGAWRPKHVEKVCSNKICVLLHHVGVLFNLMLPYIYLMRFTTHVLARLRSFPIKMS